MAGASCIFKPKNTENISISIKIAFKLKFLLKFIIIKMSELISEIYNLEYKNW